MYIIFMPPKNLLKPHWFSPKGYRTYRNSLLGNWQFCIPGRGCRGLFVLILSECGASSGAWRPTDIGGAGTTGLIPLKLFPMGREKKIETLQVNWQMHFVGLKEIQLKIDIAHGRTQFDSGQAGVKWWLLLFDSLYVIDFK